MKVFLMYQQQRLTFGIQKLLFVNIINSKKEMAWYQSEQQQFEWRKLIEKPNPSIPEMMNSQQFCIQLVKNGNTDIMTWVEDNYKYFFEQLLTRCLVLPSETDSDDRKFKEPTQAIYLLCNLLDSMAVPPSGLPTSSISGSIAGSMACSMMGNNGKVSSPDIIGFVIERMFYLYMQNVPEKLYNTLIPGYFNRLFECLNRAHTAVLTHTLRTSQHTKLQKLLETHGKFEQIIKCIQSILIVFISQSSQVTNLQMSTTFPNPGPTVLPHPSPLAGGSSQPNHPYEIKYRLLMNILNKISNFGKQDPELLENLLSIVLEIMKNIYGIFEGNHLGDYVCQPDNVAVYFAIGLGAMKEDSQQCQLKCIELLKYCLHIMHPIDRLNLIPQLKQVINFMLESSRPTILFTWMLQLLNEWLVIQSGQTSNLFTASNASMNKSLDSSLSNSSLKMSMGLVPNGIPSELQQLLSTGYLFKKLLSLCVSSPNCNIFQQRVARFISNVFKTQNIPIIECIFKENEIIKGTISNMTSFKDNPYFGYFIVIIEIYVTRRVITPIVNQALEIDTEIWNKFYIEILGPHMDKRVKNILGQMEGINDEPPLEFTSVKSEQQIKKLQEKQKVLKMQQKLKKQQSEIQMVRIELNESEKPKQKQAEHQELIEPISLKFLKKQSQSKEQKGQNESFQSFLKKKMGENNRLVDERRKSRTPTKLISGQSKRKKWGAENEMDPVLDSGKKSISADDKLVKQVNKHEEVIPKLLFLKLSKTGIPSRPKTIRERKINKQKDEHLIKWIERSKSNVKMVR